MSGRDLVASFSEPEALLAAAKAAREAGYTKLEAYSPFAVHGIDEILAVRPSRVRLVMLCGAIVGGLVGFFMQYYSAVIDYPINSGGRPLNSWPAFMLVTFEMTILTGALCGFAAMIVRSGLGTLNRPVFAIPGFERFSQDRFGLHVAASDPRFEADATRRFLEGLKPVEIVEAPA